MTINYSAFKLLFVEMIIVFFRTGIFQDEIWKGEGYIPILTKEFLHCCIFLELELKAVAI